MEVSSQIITYMYVIFYLFLPNLSINRIDLAWISSSWICPYVCEAGASRGQGAEGGGGGGGEQHLILGASSIRFSASEVLFSSQSWNTK